MFCEAFNRNFCKECFLNEDCLCYDCSRDMGICINCIYYGEGGLCENCESDEAISMDHDLNFAYEWIYFNNKWFESEIDNVSIDDNYFFDLATRQ
jgi:hypothetical protein